VCFFFSSLFCFDVLAVWLAIGCMAVRQDIQVGLPGWAELGGCFCEYHLWLGCWIGGGQDVHKKRKRKEKE